jgi:predicted ATPase
MACYTLGFSLFMSGDEVAARTHLEQGMRVYDPQHYRSPAFHSGTPDPVVSCHSGAIVLWLLGYPDQALARCQEGLVLAKELGHPATQVYAALYAAWLSSYRREARPAQEFAEQVIGLCREHGIVQFLAWGAITRGWALAEQGQAAEGIVVIQQSLAALQAQGMEAGLTSWLGQLIQAYINGGQIEEGLQTVTESLAVMERNAERSWEAELYRLKGELILQQFKVQGSTFKVQEEAEACFRWAIDVARQQQTKSWELCGSMSLARLWQGQGRREDARQLLAEVYAWFTEGFETRDLQEAKILLEEITD